jgi:hypothetical protein
MKVYIYILIILLIHIPGRTEAQEVDSLNPGVPGSLYLDIATVLLAGNASINYEIPLKKHTLLRIGFGSGYFAEWEEETTTSIGILVMVNFLTSGSDYRFEYGIGGSINRITEETTKWKALPAFVIGYRYQSYSGGFVFRIGLGYVFSYGFPLYSSAGFAL